jgi:hypothetical protein
VDPLTILWLLLDIKASFEPDTNDYLKKILQNQEEVLLTLRRMEGAIGRIERDVADLAGPERPRNRARALLQEASRLDSPERQRRLIDEALIELVDAHGIADSRNNCLAAGFVAFDLALLYGLEAEARECQRWVRRSHEHLEAGLERGCLHFTETASPTPWTFDSNRDATNIAAFDAGRPLPHPPTAAVREMADDLITVRRRTRALRRAIEPHVVSASSPALVPGPAGDSATDTDLRIAADHEPVPGPRLFLNTVTEPYEALYATDTRRARGTSRRFYVF